MYKESWYDEVNCPLSLQKQILVLLLPFSSHFFFSTSLFFFLFVCVSSGVSCGWVSNMHGITSPEMNRKWKQSNSPLGDYEKKTPRNDLAIELEILIESKLLINSDRLRISIWSIISVRIVRPRNRNSSPHMHSNAFNLNIRTSDVYFFVVFNFISFFQWYCITHGYRNVVLGYQSRINMPK